MTSYAPLTGPGDEPPECGFCGARGGPDGVLVVVGTHGGMICEECATRVSEVMARHRKPPPPPPPPTDPRDPGPPIAVDVDHRPFGDLGNPRVDARLVLAIALRDGRVAEWLRSRGVDEAAVRGEFGEMDLGWE